MKGKYITTSLLLAVLAGDNKGRSVLVDETSATTIDHTLIWSKTVSAARENMLQTKMPDELKTA